MSVQVDTSILKYSSKQGTEVRTHL